MFNNFFQVILFFFIYAFIGWVLEILTELWHHKRFVNRGFMLGPYCPIYGAAAVIITIFLSKYENDLVVLFVMSLLVCGLLEYFSSFMLETLFKARWWDYSEKKYNINGRVCLDTLVLFAIGGVVIIYFSNPLVFSLFDLLGNKIIIITTIILSVLFIIDLIISSITVHKVSKNIICEEKDNTSEISSEVRAIIKQKTYFDKRLRRAFPNLKSKVHKR